jgi:large subunit ribosomal protein L17
LRGYVEPLITKAKDNTTHSRREAFSYLQDKFATKELFDVVAPKVGNRPGGYTRIVRLGQRLGDAAEMAIIELVDFNETYKPKAAAAAEPKKKTRRSAGAAKKKAEATAEVVEEVKAEEPEVTPTEEKTEE